MFPGYILVEMIMTDEAWFIVRNTPGVTGFIGSSGKGAKPFPLTPQEVDKILSSMGMSRIDIGNDLNIDDVVKVMMAHSLECMVKLKASIFQTIKLKFYLIYLDKKQLLN